MGKVPVRMKAVIYSLSPFEQQVMPGLWKDLPAKISHKITENWISATLLLSPLVGVNLSAAVGGGAADTRAKINGRIWGYELR